MSTDRTAQDRLREASLDDLREAVGQEDWATCERIARELHPAELAGAVESLEPHLRSSLWRRIPAEARGEVLIELAGEVRDPLIAEMQPGELIAALRRLQADELADLDDSVPRAILDATMQATDAERRRRYERVRNYPDDTAGGLMDTDAIAVRPDMTVVMVLRYLRMVRHRQQGMPEHMDSVMVVDDDGRFVGVVRLADLASSPLSQPVSELLVPGAEALPDDMPAYRVARLFEDRDLISAAVVDADARLIGRITVDDIVDLIRREGEHGMLGSAGLSEEIDVLAPVVRSARRRVAWLGLHLSAAFAAAWVIGRFEATIQHMVALAVLMPVVASMGGVAGTQTLTLVTRGIALEQIGAGNARFLLRRELGVALLNGCFWALVVAGVALLWFDDARLAVVFGVALLINMFVAASAGTLLPLAMDRLNIDPALAGGVVLMAATDAAGFFTFLGLATLVLL